MTKENKKLSAEFLKHVGDYVLVETPLARADICILFGNKEHPDHLAEHAAVLYHSGHFSYIVVSGGPITDDGRSEAHRMRDILVASGVPADNIFVENKAQNTPENVIYSMALLKEKIGLGNIKSVLAIGHIHASRRFLMTLERHWPEAVKMFSTNNCFSVPRESWHIDPAFREMVLTEYERISEHMQRDIIHEIDLKKIQQEVMKLPKPSKPPSPGSPPK